MSSLLLFDSNLPQNILVLYNYNDQIEFMSISTMFVWLEDSISFSYLFHGSYCGLHFVNITANKCCLQHVFRVTQRNYRYEDG